MDKSVQRRTVLQMRRAIPETVRAAASEAICARLRSQVELSEHRVIFSYLATPDEPELAPFHHWAQSQGITMAFPVTQGAGEMEAYAPDWPWQWERGRYGIAVPQRSHARRVQPEEISLVLTPCVAFDAQLRRLGHGGGYYDRYFVRCPQAMRLGVAFAVQQVAQITCEAFDIPLHCVVTEREIFRL